MNRTLTTAFGLVLLFSSAVLADMERLKPIDHTNHGHSRNLPSHQSPRSIGRERLWHSESDERLKELFGTSRDVRRRATGPQMSQEEHKAWLGVRFRESEIKLGNQFGAEKGILIDEVIVKSPAERAGLASGDIIIKADESEIQQPSDLIDLVAGRMPGETMSLVIFRSGKEIEKKIELIVEPENSRIEQIVDIEQRLI